MRASNVLYATVESFTRRPGPLFGYAIVRDGQGRRSDLRVRLNFEDMVTPHLSEDLWCTLHDTPRPEDNRRIRLPKAGDVIVFLEAHAGGDRSKARLWTNANLWEEDLARYAAQEFRWRLVIKYWEDYAYQEYPGGLVFGDNRVTSTSVLASGTATLAALDSRDYYWLEDYMPSYGSSNEETSYDHQALGPDGQWHTLYISSTPPSHSDDEENTYVR